MKAMMIAIMTLVCSTALAQNPPVAPATSGSSPTDETLVHPKEDMGAIKVEHKSAVEQEEEKRAADNQALFPKHQADSSNATAPAAVKITEPGFQAKVPAGAVKLAWQAAEGADAYHLQVATDPNFKWLTVNDHWVHDTSFQATGLEAGKKYYWRVAPWKSSNMASTNKGNFTNSIFETQ